MTFRRHGGMDCSLTSSEGLCWGYIIILSRLRSFVPKGVDHVTKETEEGAPKGPPPPSAVRCVQTRGNYRTYDKKKQERKPRPSPQYQHSTTDYFTASKASRRMSARITANRRRNCCVKAWVANRDRIVGEVSDGAVVRPRGPGP